MSLAELLPAVLSLPAGEKRSLFQTLVDDLNANDPKAIGEMYPELFWNWSPRYAPEAVAVFKRLLNERKTTTASGDYPEERN